MPPQKNFRKQMKKFQEDHKSHFKKIQPTCPESATKTQRAQNADLVKSEPRSQEQSKKVPKIHRSLSLCDDRLKITTARPEEDLHRNSGRHQGRQSLNYAPDGPRRVRREKRGESPATRQRIKDAYHHNTRNESPEYDWEPEDETPSYAITGGFRRYDRYGGILPARRNRSLD